MSSGGTNPSSPSPVPRKKVAIVGSGCAGIAALWSLNKTHHDVYLYEAADRLGGHTNTVEWRHGKFSTDVDTGFVVLNTATYPNFINFLRKVRVKTMHSPVTFGFSRDHGRLEWAGTSLDALFCQRRRIFSPRMWRTIFDVVRFNQFALDLLTNDDAGPAETIGQYLERESYSDAFRDDYLIPLTAALWSTGPDKCTLQFPVTILARFLWNHHLLSTVSKRPCWLTLADGSKSYVDAVVKGFPPNHLFLKTPVKHVRNTPDGRVRLELENGRHETYDHVILACHGDQALAMIQPGATPLEKEILSCFKTSANTAVLHSDGSLMPRNRKAWAGWNYLALSSPRTGKASFDTVSLTYNMNVLQSIPASTFGDVFVTLNPLLQPDPATIQGRYAYEHPLLTAEAVAAQARLPEIQNKRGISYAGAWTKHGFHEDGFTSGLVVARDHLGARLPFELVDSTYARGRRPRLGLRDWALRIIILLLRLLVATAASLWVMAKRWRDRDRKRLATGANGISGRHRPGSGSESGSGAGYKLTTADTFTNSDGSINKPRFEKTPVNWFLSSEQNGRTH